MKSFRLHSLALAFFLMLFCSASYAGAQLRLMTGTKQQSLNSTSQEQQGGSPFGLITAIDFSALDNLYFSFGTSFELSTENLATSGFTVYGTALYYIYGHPQVVNASTGSLNMDFYYPYSVFLSAGVFQKQIRVKSADDDVTTNRDLGGLQVGAGLNYNLNSKMYVTSNFQLLMSGSSDAEFSSTEIYVGIGLRL